MTVTFLGATHEVTGSCTLIKVGNTNILVDCGMEQGADMFENSDIPVSANDIDCILLTHAHVDHSGKLPLLVKNGFKGNIYANDATCRLASIMLKDCANIQEQEAEWKSRKALRQGKPAIEPIYDTQDAEATISKLFPCNYGKVIQIRENVAIRFTDIGHLLGSSSIEVWLTEDGVTKKAVFSGDIGNIDQPILSDPQPTADADMVVIESTYGNRYHPEKPDYVTNFTRIIQQTFDLGGNVIIPSFAVGRTQEILYFIREIKEKGLIKGHDGFPVYVDSPMAIEATSVFLQSYEENFDEETRELLRQGINPIFFEGLNLAVSADESKLINENKTPKIIISASGMCEAGRIRHHLKHNLWKKNCTVLFVGYQAEGTLGRDILEGKKKVKLFGEKIDVKARIEFLDGVSGHADKKGLLSWLEGFEKKPAAVFVNHGDDGSVIAFTQALNDLGYNAYGPYSGTEYDLKEGKIVYAPQGVLTEKAKDEKAQNYHYNELIKAVEELTEVATASKGIANGDLREATAAINRIIARLKR